MQTNKFILLIKFLLAGFVGLGSIYISSFFVGHFNADVHHNLAIFFSKEGVWTKAPLFESKMAQYPIDIREKYLETGGALDHYETVIKLNPAYPMALYFTGNVYNDWGSQRMQESYNARSQGQVDEAIRLREKAQEMWDKSEAAYDRTKALAPNYVQTHHQVGLLYLKEGEVADNWGEKAKADELYAKAYKSFELYSMIDPIFPPNYDRMVQVLVRQKDFEKAIVLYQKCIDMNLSLSKAIYGAPAASRLSEVHQSLAKLYLTKALSVNPNPYNPDNAEVIQAIENFKKSVEFNPENVEALKGVGFLLDRVNKKEEAQVFWRKAIQLSPNDPDIKFQPALSQPVR
ncbi:MAG: tetratricopeptide repeat protein [Elusimicrobiota bacterium]